MYEQKMLKLEKEIEELKKTESLVKLQSMKIDSEKTFKEILETEIVKEKELIIFKHELKIAEYRKKEENYNHELQDQKKQNKYYKELFDRDLQTQELDKKYKIMLYDFEKLDQKNQMLTNQLTLAQEDLNNTNYMYNSKIEEFKKVNKAVLELRNEYGILRKKKIKETQKQEKAARPGFFHFFKKKPKKILEDKISINLEKQEQKLPSFQDFALQQQTVESDFENIQKQIKTEIPKTKIPVIHIDEDNYIDFTEKKWSQSKNK